VDQEVFDQLAHIYRDLTITLEIRKRRYLLTAKIGLLHFNQLSADSLASELTGGEMYGTADVRYSWPTSLMSVTHVFLGRRLILGMNTVLLIERD
jgi:hypothetical protein